MEVTTQMTTDGGGSADSTGSGSQESKTFTQEQVDSIIANRLRDERHRAEKAEKDAKAARDELQRLKSDSDSSKSEMQRLAERVEAAEKRQVEAERKALIAEVAAEKKLPPALARRLTGTTREELEADADELVSAVGGKGSDEDGNGAAGKGDDDSGSGASGDSSSRRPKEKLRGGASSEESTESPEDLADQVWKRTRGEI